MLVDLVVGESSSSSCMPYDVSPTRKAWRWELFQPMAARSIWPSLASLTVPGTSSRRQTTGSTSLS